MLRSVEERISASHQMVAAGVSLLVLSTISVALRFLSRRISRSKIWWDDWLCLGGLCAFAGFCGNIYGNFPRHWDDAKYPLSEADKVGIAKSVYAEVLTYYFIQLCLKCSVLAFYWRLFSSSIIRNPMIIMFGMVVVWFVIVEFLAAFQCLPVHSIWEATSTPPKCIKLNVFFWGASIPNILFDVFLIILPMPDLYRLRIPRAQKCFIMGIFCLGGFVLFASAFRLYYAIHLDDEDFKKNWMIHKSVLWTVAEHGTGIICICLAPSRPFFAKIPCIASILSRAENAPVDAPSFSWWKPAPDAPKKPTTATTTDVTTGMMGTTATCNSRASMTVDIERAVPKQVRDTAGR